MERDNGRSRMGFALMVSLLVHAAVILLVPVVSPDRVVIFPVEFGEIEQAFEPPREGSPDGQAAAAPQPDVKPVSPAAQGDGSETQIALKPAPKPEPKPVPEPKPARAVSLKPAPKAEQKTPAPAKAQVADSQKKEQSPKTGTASGGQATDARGESKPSAKPAITQPETAATGAGEREGASAGAGGATSESVLTGKSGETIPLARGGPSQGAGADASGTTPAGGSPAEAGQGAGWTGAGLAGHSEPAGPEAAAAPAAPPKPRGEQFGTGRALVLSGVPPVYPKNAQNEGVEGVVMLAVTVDAVGTATSVVVKDGSGDPRLDEAAMRTISRGWRFQAIGWPYELSVRVTFRESSVELVFGGVRILGD
ncbi:MAG: TonB family protein [Clostridia bacterium]